MPDFGQSQFDRLIAEQYEAVKDEVLATVRGKLAAANLHPDPLDLDAAYNAAWHALYEQSLRGGATVENLGGWLATIAYRRAIDDIRSAQLRRHVVTVGGEDADASLSQGRYQRDLDDELSAREKYHQWLMSVRLRLTDREQQAVSLCILHERSRKEASAIMGIDVRRLDKVMTAANKKLGGTLEAISRGDWCENQRSLIKAYAFGLHEPGGERHQLAIQHIMHCQACAAYVRSVRGLAGIMPPSALLAGAASVGGGILTGLAAAFKGGTSGGAAVGGAGGAVAGGGSATLLGGLGAKSAAVCATAVCATGGALAVIETAPPRDREPNSASAPNPPTRRAAAPVAASPRPAPVRPQTRTSPGSTSASSRRSRAAPPDPDSQAAQETAEFGIEPQATQAAIPARAAATAPPPPAAPAEFDFEGG